MYGGSVYSDLVVAVQPTTRLIVDPDQVRYNRARMIHVIATMDLSDPGIQQTNLMAFMIYRLLESENCRAEALKELVIAERNRADAERDRANSLHQQLLDTKHSEKERRPKNQVRCMICEKLIAKTWISRHMQTHEKK